MPRVCQVVDSVNETPTPNPEGVTAKIPTFPTEFDVAEVRPAKPLELRPGQQLGPLGQANLQNGRVEIMSATRTSLIKGAGAEHGRQHVSRRPEVDG